MQSPPFPTLNLRKRRENQQRLAEFGPENEILFTIPDDGPGFYFKRFSSDGRVNLLHICLYMHIIYYFIVLVCFWG